MTLASLEKEIAFETGIVLNNPAFKRKDIREWSSGEIKPQKDESVVYVTKVGMNVVFFSKMDKRPKGNQP